MIFQRLRVFVSSKMQELATERQAVKEALDALKVDAWVFEQDAGARPVSIEKAFLKEVEEADLYIGLFWKGYGDYTIEEYEHARKLGKDCLIYEKRAALNVQRDPRLQAFLDRIGNVERGLTIKWFDDPLQLSEAIKDDVAKWQARIIRERRTPQINLNLSLAEKKERDELLILLRKVKEFWVEGVLEKSVHGQALIDLDKEAWTEKTEHPWEQILELPDQTSRRLRPGELIGELFSEVGRSLLILGGPGSGKTITLLVLARELIGCAEGDPVQPIPVVFNLSSWTDPRQNLLDWLIAELLAKYQVPKRIGSRWLEANWIVPLLDGLDEVMTANQSACVEAINAYVQTQGAPGLAVCSRLKEYTDLPVRLHVTGAICLQPLPPEQVKGYVARSGDALSGLSAVLDKDQALLTLAETPLMLDVMSMAYRDLPAEELSSDLLNTEKERRSHLFDTYIDKMFIRKGKGAQEYAREQTLGWLSWLASGMQQHGQTVFLIEQLQPSWLAKRAQRVLYMLGSRMVVGLTFGVILGLMFALGNNLVNGESLNLVYQLFFGLISGLIGGLIFGSVIGLLENWHYTSRERRKQTSPGWQRIIYLPIFWLLLFGLIIGLIFREAAGILFGVVLFVAWCISSLRSGHRSLKSDITTLETLRLSRADIQKALVGGLCSLLVFGPIAWFFFGFGRNFAFGLSLVLFFAVSNAFFGGLQRVILNTKAVPNFGIKLPIRNALVAGGIGLDVFGLLVAIIWGLSLGLREGLDGALFFGTLYGLIAFFVYGGQDVIQHYTLRFILYWRGHTPLRYANFLDYAARLVFLQKVGGGYIFIHRLLLEHFATMEDERKTLPELGSALRPRSVYKPAL